MIDSILAAQVSLACKSQFSIFQAFLLPGAKVSLLNFGCTVLCKTLESFLISKYVFQRSPYFFKMVLISSFLGFLLVFTDFLWLLLRLSARLLPSPSDNLTTFR